MQIEITDNSPKVKEELEAAVLKALTICGLTAEAYAKPLAPVDTGLLRNSITWAISGEAPAISAYEADKPDKQGVIRKGSYSGTAPSDSGDEKSVYIGSNVSYSDSVELGTVKQKAQPYLKPAVADHVSQYKQIIESTLKG